MTANAAAVQRTHSEILHHYGSAKNRRDVKAALSVCTEGFRLVTPAFGVGSRSKEETAVILDLFFAAFPDYECAIEKEAYGDGSLACWGSMRVTMKGDLVGCAATGRRAAVPVASIVGFDGERMTYEVFYFSLGELCSQLGLPLDAVWAGMQRAAAAQQGAESAPAAS